MTIHRHRYGNGFLALWCADDATDALVDAVSRAATEDAMAIAIVWFSPDGLDAGRFAETLHRDVPGLTVCGCSTCGEITPGGLQGGGAVVLLMPARHVDVSVTLIENVDTAGMQQIARCASRARDDFLDRWGRDSGSIFAMTLIDGLTFAEDATTAAVQQGLEDIPLVGGSAGDDLEFRRTVLIHRGQVHDRAAILLLVRSRLPYRLFTDNNFVPTAEKLVVTRSDADRRIVYEFNAEPAAHAYAEAIGGEAAGLRAMSFAAHPLILTIGGEHFCRSIQSMNPDDSLTFFCAIDDGLVLTVARPEGMVRSSHLLLESIETHIGPLDCVIGYDCIYRKLDAAHRHVTDRMEALFRDRHVVGCNTYGEQFGATHVNQTFTGVAFGRASP